MINLFGVISIILAIVVSGIVVMGRIVPMMVSSSNTSEVILGLVAAIVWIFATIGFIVAAARKLFDGENNASK